MIKISLKHCQHNISVYHDHCEPFLRLAFFMLLVYLYTYKSRSANISNMREFRNIQFATYVRGVVLAKNQTHHNAIHINDVSNSFFVYMYIFVKIILDIFSHENSIYCQKMWQFDIKKTEFLRNPSFLMRIICDYLQACSIVTTAYGLQISFMLKKVSFFTL